MKNWIKELENIMGQLREGCAWDKKQNYQSLKKYLIEECGEFLDAVDKKNFSEMREELGDILINICFYAQLAKEDGQFDLQKVAEVGVEKMIRRHPHVFGDSKAQTLEEISKQWQKIKKTEKVTEKTLSEEIPRNIPALMRAQKIQNKVSYSGLDWKNWQGPLNKLKEEINELEKALNLNDKSKVKEELGDVLFSAINIARHQNICGEKSLHSSTDKFIKRFEKIKLLTNNDLKGLGEKKLEKLWKQVKKAED